jgi:hypothetical protein
MLSQRLPRPPTRLLLLSKHPLQLFSLSFDDVHHLFPIVVVCLALCFCFFFNNLL